jgi:mannose-6-phosphate isomerase-like protein (cupin superfamily)
MFGAELASGRLTGMANHATHVVVRDDATHGTRGERLLAAGRHVGLRIWERDPASERSVAPDPANERVAYVASGVLVVAVAGDPPVEIRAGDSYVVPPGAGHRYEVLEPATVVEAVCPPTTND